MKELPLGRSGLNVSELCLGTMLFGVSVSEEVSFSLMDYYYEQGGRFFDTANKYATWIPGFPDPVGEHVLGRWIKSRGCRNEVVIATKMGLAYHDVPRGLKKELILQEADKSLKRLGVERIDLLYAHADDYSVPQEETMEAFHELVEAGKVRSLGASNFYAWRMAKANDLARERGWTPFCCLQARLSAVWPRTHAGFGIQRPASPEVIDYCRSEDIALLAFSPLLKGFFGRTDRDIPDTYDTPDSREIVRLFREEASSQGVSANTLVLGWLREQGFIPLITGSTPEQMKENMASLSCSPGEECSGKIKDLFFPQTG